MRKWEYDWFKETLGDWQDILKRMGNDGWELVNVVHDGKSLVFFLKRPKP